MMSKLVAGVFDTDSELDNALNSLYSHNVKSDDIEIHRHNDGTVTGGAAIPIAPVALNTSGGSAVNNQGGAAPALAALSTATISRIGGGEAMDYYNGVIRQGGIVVFVRTDDDNTANAITRTFQNHQASRVDQFD